MRSLGYVLVLLGSLGYLGCTHPCGQSGTRGNPIDCGTLNSRSVGLDEQTPAGSARALFDSVASPATAALRWYSYDGTSSYSDTTLTFSVSGAPGTATYSWYSNSSPSCEQRQQISVDGAVLRFVTADGAFDESIPGAVSTSSSGERRFDADLITPHFTGTYATSGLAQRFGTSELWLSTGFSPANGWLYVRANPPACGAADLSYGRIATWSATLTGGSMGTGGSMESDASGGK